jgi:hypothetical protein
VPYTVTSIGWRCLKYCVRVPRVEPGPTSLALRRRDRRGPSDGQYTTTPWDRTDRMCREIRRLSQIDGETRYD